MEEGLVLLTGSLSGLHVLVVGLGRLGGGVTVTRWLVGRGARVTVTDLAGADALGDSVARISDLDVILRLGGHRASDLDGVDLVIVNPAVDKTRSEFFGEVLRRGVPWTTEMNLFCERCRAPVIGVTGTYGKSTTCAMLAEVLRARLMAGNCEYTGVHLGGNIGLSLLMELDSIKPTDLVVLEMSNAQLEDLPRVSVAPRVSVITNLRPNHLDRHGSWEAYVRAKLNIVMDPQGESTIILGDVGPDVRAMLEELAPNAGSRLVHVEPADPPVELKVAGVHNRRNADCVLAIGRRLGLDEPIVRAALGEFAGLPHRLECVRTVEGVDYVNDSKSTSPAATVTAVECFDGPIVAIVGGKDKGVSLSDCASALVRSCRAVVCTGESGPAFARAVRDVKGRRTQPAIHECDGLDEGLQAARACAVSGDTVLYAPGCPSFDAYANFEHRGRHFAELVEAL